MGKINLPIKQVDFSNDNMEFKWYPVVTIPKYEQKVGDSLKMRFESLGAGDKFGEVLVPIKEWTEEVVSSKMKKDGTYSKRIATRRQNVMVDGYIFVRMIMDNSTWNIVRQTTGVAGYLKADGRPGPVADEEVARIKGMLYEGQAENNVVEFNGKVGDTIKIKTLNGTEAIVTEILSEKGFLKAVTELGLKLEVELNNVELVS